MRVIAGLAKGLQLKAPNTSKVRPAADKVKGALFNILGDISGTRVLDLFAGSGSVGIEALSRGAATCTFVEADRNIASYIEKNLKHCKLEKKATILVQKVNKAIPWLEKKKQSFDLIFVDPPYDKNLLNPTLELLISSSLLSYHTLIVCEHSPRELPNKIIANLNQLDDKRKQAQQAIAVEGEAPAALPMEGATRAPVIERLEITDSRKYGQTLISFMQIAPSPQPMASPPWRASPSRGEGVRRTDEGEKRK